MAFSLGISKILGIRAGSECRMKSCGDPELGTQCQSEGGNSLAFSGFFSGFLWPVAFSFGMLQNSWFVLLLPSSRP